MVRASSWTYTHRTASSKARLDKIAAVDGGFAEERQRTERLVEEIIAGEHKIDKLPNSSAGFSGAAQAEYFSKARYHLESDVSNLIVNHKQQLDELQLLKMIKGQE